MKNNLIAITLGDNDFTNTLRMFLRSLKDGLYEGCLVETDFTVERITYLWNESCMHFYQLAQNGFDSRGIEAETHTREYLKSKFYAQVISSFEELKRRDGSKMESSHFDHNIAYLHINTYRVESTTIGIL
jgi:hypothetical protein